MICRRCGIAVLLSLTLMGCLSGPPKPPKAEPVYPVKGIVKIDGEPKANVHVFFTKATRPEDLSTDPLTPQNAVANGGVTNANGEFSASTYVAGDGLAAGDYVVTFFWTGAAPSLDVMNTEDQPMSAAGAKFSRKFSIPNSDNAIKYTVKKEPNDVGVWDLSTK